MPKEEFRVRFTLMEVQTLTALINGAYEKGDGKMRKRYANILRKFDASQS
jgi:hypothetical protein